jgi:hypothetical protein
MAPFVVERRSETDMGSGRADLHESLHHQQSLRFIFLIFHKQQSRSVSSFQIESIPSTTYTTSQHCSILRPNLPIFLPARLQPHFYSNPNIPRLLLCTSPSKSNPSSSRPILA